MGETDEIQTTSTLGNSIRSESLNFSNSITKVLGIEFENYRIPFCIYLYRIMANPV